MAEKQQKNPCEAYIKAYNALRVKAQTYVALGVISGVVMGFFTGLMLGR